MIKYNIASINRCTETEGPYKRLTIWFQGCNILCDDCCNPDFQPFICKNVLSLDELINIIKEAKEEFGIEGVTLSGGEPTVQLNLSILIDKIHELGLGIISFTGRSYEDVSSILCNCDVVLDGKFDKNKIESKRKLLGSTNQRIIELTDRYSSVIDWFYKPTKDIDVNVGETIVLNGDKI